MAARKNDAGQRLIEWIEKQIAPYEKKWAMKNRIPEGGCKTPARHLTDSEIEILHAAYKRGYNRLNSKFGSAMTQTYLSRLVEAIEDLEPNDPDFSSKQSEIITLAEQIKMATADSWTLERVSLIVRILNNQKSEGWRLIYFIASEIKYRF